MGIGMTLIVARKSVAAVEKAAAKAGVAAYRIGEIRKGRREVVIE